MKKEVITLGLVGILSFSGISQAGTLSSADKAFLFGSQSIQVKTLSVEEIKNTNGKLWWIGVIYAVRTGYSLYRTYKAYRYYKSFKKAFRVGKFVWRNTGNYKTWSYKGKEAKYGRFARSITWYNSQGKRWLTIDFHKVPNKPWYYRFHYHRRPGIKWHRPWEKGW